MGYPIHSFDVTLDEAKRIQRELRDRVILSDQIPVDNVSIVGGVDIAFVSEYRGAAGRYDLAAVSAEREDSHTAGSPDGHYRREIRGTAVAAVVTFDVRNGIVLETAFATAPVFFPYIPGFLSFREGPAVLAAIEELSVPPGVMIYDGCGIAHPRGFGLASHMAVLTGIPSVGCAKSRLCGSCDEPSPVKGSWTGLVYKDRRVGVCLRTRDGVRPVYVSPGSGFSVDGARELVLTTVGKFRLPEPTRLAHTYVTAKKKELAKSFNNGNEV